MFVNFLMGFNLKNENDIDLKIKILEG